MKLVGHGIDIVEISRIRELLVTAGDEFELAWFTSAEREIAHERPDLAMFYAGRHAAKEAVLKALGTGLTRDVAPTDIDVLTQESGAPTVVLSGGALAIANQRGIKRWLLSISDTEQYVIASVLAVQDDA